MNPIEPCGIIRHHPLEGTLFGGCQVQKLGLAAFEVELPDARMLIIAKTPWKTHTLMVVDAGGTRRHIVTYGPPGKPHVSPACPFEAKIYGEPPSGPTD